MTETLRRSVYCSFGLANGAGESGHAGPVRTAYPEKSAADYLIESPTVVLAREDPQQPFSYTSVEVLKSSGDGIDIELLVDSVTRRRLAANEELVVVLAQDGKFGLWRNLGIADTDYLAVVRRIV